MRAWEMDRLYELLPAVARYLLATRPNCAWVMLELYTGRRRGDFMPRRILAATDVIQADGYRHDDAMRREAESIIARAMDWSFVDDAVVAGPPLAGPFFVRREAVSAHELLAAQRRFMTR